MNPPSDPFFMQTAAWGWTIAIYLFLVGISVGSVTFAVFIKRKLGPEASRNAVIKSMAILAPAGIIIGLTILIFHLVRPWTFWRLMVYYQWRSIMSIGVILFQAYMVVLLVWLAGIYRNELTALRQRWLKNRFAFIDALIHFCPKLDKPVEVSLLVMATLLGAYTGFVLSVLQSFPMFNNPVLPVLFLVSGFSSGIAATTVLAVTVFKESTHSPEIRFMHNFELPLVLTEIFLFVCFFAGLYYGGEQKIISLLTVLGSGFWPAVFWYGVVGVGIVAPLLIRFLNPSGQHAKGQVLLTCCLTLAGILMLRHYILYAGQLVLV